MGEALDTGNGRPFTIPLLLLCNFFSVHQSDSYRYKPIAEGVTS
jgi:hypothetical protein